MNEEYKEENIRLTIKYLEHILEMFKNKNIDLAGSIHYEHFFYYDVYLPLLQEFKEESRYKEMEENEK
jgi:hypothetical protein